MQETHNIAQPVVSQKTPTHTRLGTKDVTIDPLEEISLTKSLLSDALFFFILEVTSGLGVMEKFSNTYIEISSQWSGTFLWNFTQLGCVSVKTLI